MEWEIGMTDTQLGPGAQIALKTVPNLRDLGGYSVSGGGTVRSGRLYRSVALDRLSPEDAEALAGFGIRTVFDLRTEAERSAAPDRAVGRAHEVVCDVLAGATQAAPAQLLEVVKSPARAAELLGGGKAQRLFQSAYRQIVSSASALQAYREFFEAIAQDENVPALFHCTTGKDRTGWAAASTLLLLGVDEAQVMREYELTNRDLLPALDFLFKQFAAEGGDPEILRPVVGVDPVYLQTALDEMHQRFGSITAYFRDGLGIDEVEQDRLRAAFIA